MNANDFIEQLELALASVRSERTVLTRFEPGFVGGHGSVFVTFVNLPFARFKERRGGGAESENNRVLFSIQGFSDSSTPAAKITIETLVNNVTPREQRLRKKTASPAKVAEYLASYIGEVARNFPPNFTHE